MGIFHVTGTNHVGIVVEDLDRFIRIMTDLFDYKLTDRGPRDVDRQEILTGVPGANVEVAYVVGGGFTIELQCYCKKTPNTKKYTPRVTDIGHWHLSIFIEDIEAIREKAPAYGLREVGKKIMVTKGPNTGNQIIFLQSEEGVVFELTQKG